MAVTVDVNELTKLTYEIGELSQFKQGGYVTTPNGTTTVITDSGYVTTIPNGTTWVVPNNVPYIVRTEHYESTDEDGNTSYTEVAVLSDGTIHVDPGAFKLLMEMAGFERVD